MKAASTLNDLPPPSQPDNIPVLLAASFKFHLCEAFSDPSRQSYSLPLCSQNTLNGSLLLAHCIEVVGLQVCLSPFLRLWTPQHLVGRDTEWIIRKPLCLAPGRAWMGCWDRWLIRDGLAGSRLPSWGRCFHSLFYFPNASWLSTPSKRQIFQSTCLRALFKLCPHSGYKGRSVLAATWGLLLPLSTGSRALSFCNWPPFMPASLRIFPSW